MNRLNANLARTLCPQAVEAAGLCPERVLQIGSGNFLRGFTCWMVDCMIQGGHFAGRIVVTQATPFSEAVKQLNEQDGFYTLLSRGLDGGRPVERAELITSVSRGLNPYEKWDDYIALACRRDLHFVISNTTEAGIVYRPKPDPGNFCGPNFPTQLTKFLYARYKRFHGDADKGLVFFPCELVNRNGDTLRQAVLHHAADWKMESGFSDWVRSACRFCNTLVDRIVPGYPADEIEQISGQLGYEDPLMVAAEMYHSWVIEGDDALAAQWPLAEAGINVIWTEDLDPYQTRKVRILNGAHTMMVPVAFLMGHDTVRESTQDPRILAYIRKGLFDEVIPMLPLAPAPTRAFAEDVLSRFANPYMHHLLLSIALNSISKWRVRVLPSIEAYLRVREQLPRALTFSLAALMAFYRVSLSEEMLAEGRRKGEPYKIKDENDVLTAFSEVWSTYETAHDVKGLCRFLLGQRRLWNDDLNEIEGLTDQVSSDLDTILRRGMAGALAEVV